MAFDFKYKYIPDMVCELILQQRLTKKYGQP